MSSPNPYVPNPSAETLAEFGLYNEVLDAAGEALVSLDEALMKQRDREGFRSSNTERSSEDFARRFTTRRGEVR